MTKIKYFVLTAAASLVFTACGAPAGNSPAANNANASNANTAKPVAAAPTKDALMSLEKSGWEAWKNKDFKTFDTLMSDKYVGFSAGARVDKAASIKAMSESKYEVKSYSLSDDQMTKLGPDAALLTFKAAQDYTMDGKPGPKEVWSASVYVRNGDKWQEAYYNEMPVLDPKAPPAKPSAKPAAGAKPATAAKPADAATEELLAVEKKGWEAWKARDAKAFEPIAAKDLSIIDSGTRYDYAGTMKLWFESKCDIKSYSLSDAASAAFGQDMGILTFKSSTSGTCEGQPLGAAWNTSIYVKDGGSWKLAFSFTSPM